MRGHVVKRGKARYSLVLEQSESGLRKQKWVAFRGTKKAADAKLVELLHQASAGTLILPGKITVAQFLEHWLENYCTPNLGRRTTDGYRDIVRRRLIPNLGSILLAELKPERIQRLYAQLLKNGRLDGKGGLTPRSVQAYHQCLHRALKMAVEWELVGRNPADAVRLPKVQHHEIAPIDEDEARRVLEAAKGTPYHAIIHLALHTGMRRSELLGLKWADVDLTLGQIEVKRTLHQTRDRSIDIRAPKTDKGRRPIPLPPSATLTLRDYWAEQDRIHTELGKPLQSGDFVFCDPDGSCWLPDRVTHFWVRLRNKVGVKARWHDLRHTHATVLLIQGVHPKIVQERLGHASIGITVDTYSHVVPGLQQAAAKGFDEWLAPKQPQPEKEAFEKIR